MSTSADDSARTNFAQLVETAGAVAERGRRRSVDEERERVAQLAGQRAAEAEQAARAAMALRDRIEEQMEVERLTGELKRRLESLHREREDAQAARMAAREQAERERAVASRRVSPGVVALCVVVALVVVGVGAVVASERMDSSPAADAAPTTAPVAPREDLSSTRAEIARARARVADLQLANAATVSPTPAIRTVRPRSSLQRPRVATPGFEVEDGPDLVTATGLEGGPRARPRR